MKLNHPGIYRIVGKEFELLAIVIGEVPCLRITSAILINDAVNKSRFTVLQEDSNEIQQVILNPDKFIFIEYEYSEYICKSDINKSIRGNKMPDITNDQVNEILARYIRDTSINGRGIAATRAYLAETTDWSIGQINIVLMKIAKLASKQTFMFYDN